MVELTVGYVAGIIAGAFFLAGVFAPNLITLIISSQLQSRASASTWNVAARAFQHSHWPDILSTDVTLVRGVRKDIVILARLMDFMAALIAISGVVTPFGLYQTLKTGGSVQSPFKYLVDNSPFGYSTPPRSDVTFNRHCSSGLVSPSPCPFTDSLSTVKSFPNGTINVTFPYGIDIDIPAVQTNVFSSGTDDTTTVSNFFDIQWRRYSTFRDERGVLNNGSAYLTGAFRTIQTMVMNNAMDVVEGLVVDNIKGGVGFRNHTVPPAFKHGVEWKEDLLFIEPETSCVDTNLTIDFIVEGENGALVNEVVLTDRGGFVNLNPTYPIVDMDHPQMSPNLQQRAHKAAWLQNTMIMLLWNITNPTGANRESFSYINSHINASYRIKTSTKLRSDGFENLEIIGNFGDFVLSDGAGTITNSSFGSTNPWSISSKNFSTISIDCSSSELGDEANSSNILIGCGNMIGIPQRMNTGHPLVFDEGSLWSQKIFTCASAVKSTIKTVTFNYSGTELDMREFVVKSIEQKEYNDTNSTPLWGIENPGDAFRSNDINLLWGLIAPEHENMPNITAFRARALYLPGFIDTSNSSRANDAFNIPASSFPVGAVSAAYCVNSGGGSQCGRSFTGNDYSGANSMGMWARWQNLTKDAKSASTIPNLIWTDTAASAVVGTKGVLGPGNTSHENRVALSVIPIVQTISYRYVYAIPAFLAAFLLGVIIIIALGVSCLRGIKLNQLQNHMHQLSPGRILTAFLVPESGEMTMSSNEWGQYLGRKQIDISSGFPVVVELPNAARKNAAF